MPRPVVGRWRTRAGRRRTGLVRVARHSRPRPVRRYKGAAAEKRDSRRRGGRKGTGQRDGGGKRRAPSEATSAQCLPVPSRCLPLPPGDPPPAARPSGEHSSAPPSSPFPRNGPASRSAKGTSALDPRLSASAPGPRAEKGPPQAAVGTSARQGPGSAASTPDDASDRRRMERKAESRPAADGRARQRRLSRPPSFPRGRLASPSPAQAGPRVARPRPRRSPASRYAVRSPRPFGNAARGELDACPTPALVAPRRRSAGAPPRASMRRRRLQPGPPRRRARAARGLGGEPRPASAPAASSQTSSSDVLRRGDARAAAQHGAPPGRARPACRRGEGAAPGTRRTLQRRAPSVQRQPAEAAAGQSRPRRARGRPSPPGRAGRPPRDARPPGGHRTAGMASSALPTRRALHVLFDTISRAYLRGCGRRHRR